MDRPPSPARRRKARRLALQALYQWLLARDDPETVAAQFRDAGQGKVDWEHFDALFPAAARRAEELDARLAPLLDREVGALDPVERAALYLGAFELQERPDVPWRVVVSECVELAKVFGGEGGHKYVNGVLDRLAGELRPEAARGPLTESETVRRLLAGPGPAFPRDGVRLGAGDDAAALAVPAGRLLCVSADTLVEGVHFPAGTEPEQVGRRALAVNLSDLAAMGASPLCFTLSLTLPAADRDWLDGFSRGLAAPAREHDCPLVGGDTNAGPLSVTIQVHGLVAEDAMIRRNGAKPGDRIYVSGCLGDGAVALAVLGCGTHLGAAFEVDAKALDAAQRGYLERAFYRPTPRIALGRACGALVSAGIDVSDGLDGDLGHILKASGVGAAVRLEALPRSAAAARCAGPEAWRLAALFGGDDYELCLTVPPERCGELEALASELDTPLRAIGEIAAGRGVRYLGADGAEVAMDAAASWRHFGPRTAP